MFILLLATTFAAAVHYVTTAPASYTELRGHQQADHEVNRKSIIQAVLDELEQAALVQNYIQAKMESWEKVKQAAGKVVSFFHHLLNGPDSGTGFSDCN